MFGLSQVGHVRLPRIILTPCRYDPIRWNIYDFSLITSSWAMFIVRKAGHCGGVGWLCKGLKIYRTTRPFRIVQRSVALQQTVHMLCMSVRPIGNLLLLGTMFYLIFAIWGVQMLKGRLFYCDKSTVDTSEFSVGQATPAYIYCVHMCVYTHAHHHRLGRSACAALRCAGRGHRTCLVFRVEQ